MPVKVHKFTFPLNFMVLDIGENEGIPLIISPSLLLISIFNIDLKEDTLTLKVYTEVLTLNVLNIKKQKKNVIFIKSS